ncbi:hypothetical protein ACX80H_06965 [Arthrobacter sp. MDT2-2]
MAGVNALTPAGFPTRTAAVSSGVVVVVRPDQNVAVVVPLDATGELEQFFAGLHSPLRTAQRATWQVSRERSERPGLREREGGGVPTTGHR